MWLIVGLGNVGGEYERTRHNVGWLVLEEVMQKMSFPAPVVSIQYSAHFAEGMLHGVETTMLFPTTYMNNSGIAVVKYLKKNDIPLANLIVVHDDVDLPFGEVRVSFDRGAGGHNGVSSVIKECGSGAFVRVRIGVTQKGLFGILKRPKGDKLSAYVLGTFKPGELKLIPEIAERVSVALLHIVEDGVEKAMQEVNRK